MKQSRLTSFIESAINILVGFGISLGAQMVFLPMLGVPISHTQNFIFACIMTVISLARSFILRRIFEALHIRNPLSPALLAIAAERRRQIEVEGWTHEHDDDHHRGELALAAACYAEFAGYQSGAVTPVGDWTEKPPGCWPWSHDWWKPAGFRRDLVKAGALILAELERFDRNRKRAGIKAAEIPATRARSPLPENEFAPSCRVSGHQS